MAYVQSRKNAAGEITSWRVCWRENGGRGLATQQETFDDKPAAEVFRAAVDAAGQRWPGGWVKGEGYVAPEAEPADERYRFRAFATTVIEERTGIEERYRRACLRELETYVFPTFGECDVRSAEHFSTDTIRRWVRMLERTRVSRGRMAADSDKRPLMSPKTIRNLHGLLSSILTEAVQAEPPLRARNPCERTRLPRADDEIEDEMTFLTPQEVAGLRGWFTTSLQDQHMVTVAYGTGMRYGELTALQPRDILDRHSDKPKIRVQRAWKRDEEGHYYLGKPKTKKARRTIRISPAVLAALVAAGLDRVGRTEMLFTGAEPGSRLHYSSFGDRWGRAVTRAQRAGALSPDKCPTPHDLRHSHVAALISAGHGLPYVQRRVGHESIQTTNDRYGHLLPEADDDAMETIETSLTGHRPRLRPVG